MRLHHLTRHKLSLRPVVSRVTGLLPSRRSPYGKEAGVSLVEFTLVLPLLLLLLFGIVDFGKAFNYWIDQTHLSNTGARFAVVNRNPAPPGTTLQDYIAGLANTDELRNGGTPSVPNNITVCIEFPNGGSAATALIGDPVRVRVFADYNWLPFLAKDLPFATSTLSGEATMRLEQRPTNYVDGCST